MSVHNTILLTAPDPRGRFLEGYLSEDAKPGMVVSPKPGTVNIDGRHMWEPFVGSAIGSGVMAVLLENWFLGRDLRATYRAGERCRLYVPLRGDELKVLAVGEDSIVFTDGLAVVSGIGTVVKTELSDSAAFHAEEDVEVLDPSGTLVHCSFVGGRAIAATSTEEEAGPPVCVTSTWLDVWLPQLEINGSTTDEICQLFGSPNPASGYYALNNFAGEPCVWHLNGASMQGVVLDHPFKIWMRADTYNFGVPGDYRLRIVVDIRDATDGGTIDSELYARLVYKGPDIDVATVAELNDSPLELVSYVELPAASGIIHCLAPGNGILFPT